MKRRVPLIIALIFTLGLVFLASHGCEDSLKYEIYALQGRAERHLLSQGTINDAGRNPRTSESVFFGRSFQQKWIQLNSEFSLGASIFRDKRLDGFGLWIRRNGKGFSWNWFTREAGLVFRKLQGDGRVEASLSPNDEYQELAAVTFLDDVTLTGQFGLLPFWDTHQVVIKKGSVLHLNR